MAQKPSKHAFETAKERIKFLEAVGDQRREELAHANDERRRLERELVGAQHEITNRIGMTTEMASRIGVLESDRDRLTTVVEVLARRLMSPAAEKDRSRAGWRALTNQMEPAPKS